LLAAVVLMGAACTGNANGSKGSDHAQGAARSSPFKGKGTYETSNVKLTTSEAGGEEVWWLHFDARWKGTGHPVGHGCEYRILNGSGRPIATDTFTINIASESAEGVKLRIEPPKGDATPSSAEIRC
jgi:hypothetical protein